MCYPHPLIWTIASLDFFIRCPLLADRSDIGYILSAKIIVLLLINEVLNKNKKDHWLQVDLGKVIEVCAKVNFSVS